MKKFLIYMIAFAALGIAAAPVYADDSHHPKADSHHPNAPAQQSYTVMGEVVVVDKEASKVNLKHEAVPDLDWPAMTMFFPVADRSQLDILKVGDQVEFEFAITDSGGPLITQIKPVK